MRYNVSDNNGLGIPLNGGTEMKVATYVRVSTVFEEQDSSLINQEEGLIDYIRKNGWVLYATYSERQSSFKTRDEFKRLVKDAKNKKFNIILVKSLSRFGRSVGELNTVIPELVQQGIRFIAISEGIDTNNNSWQTDVMMYSLVYNMSSKTTSDWIRLAERARAKRGEFTGSSTPYGYQKIDKKLVLADDHTPDVVQRIFDLYLEGVLGMQAIANVLTNEKIPTPAQTQGRKNANKYWTYSSIEYILTNPAYVGDLIAQKEQAVTLGSTRRKANESEHQVIIRDNHPKIISREQFQAVQDLIYRRGRKKSCGMPNLFTHVLHCADCGAGMHCVKRPYGKTHYMCGNYKLRGKDYCSRHSVYESQLVDLILNDIRKLMEEHMDGDSFRKKLQQEAEFGRKSAAREILSIEKKIEQTEKRINTAEDRWLDKEISKEKYHQLIERYEKDLSEYRQRLSELTKDQQMNKPKLPDIARLTSFEKLDRELLLLLVKRIDVKENGDVKITYNFTV